MSKIFSGEHVSNPVILDERKCSFEDMRSNDFFLPKDFIHHVKSGLHKCQHIECSIQTVHAEWEEDPSEKEQRFTWELTHFMNNQWIQ